MKRSSMIENISPILWEGSCLGSECSLHQMAPFIGKMKSSMAETLISFCSESGDTVLDPFVGSGSVALESIIKGRGVICSDTNPYAVALTRAKIFVPPTIDQALASCECYLDIAEDKAANIDLSEVPKWVVKFYHSETLREIIALFNILKEHREYFLIGCLLGILHHQRPGFLSYPASHAVPYLRTKRFPRESYPELYNYRKVRPRLRKKITRVLRRVPDIDPAIIRKCHHKDMKSLNLPESSIDAVITSPPYMNTLDYIRDNRLRLWFLGCEREKYVDENSPKNIHEFKQLIADFFMMVDKVLRPKGKCAIVTGEVNKNGRNRNTATVILETAKEVGTFDHVATVEDSIPANRRVRRASRCTRREWIIVFRKRL